MLWSLCACVRSGSIKSDSLQPYGLEPTRLLWQWNCPGNTRAGCHFLLEGILPTQGSNPHLLHYRQILYHWATLNPVVSVCIKEKEMMWRQRQRVNGVYNPRIAHGHHRQERDPGWKPCLEPQEEPTLLMTLISDFWISGLHKSDRIHFCYFKLSRLW